MKVGVLCEFSGTVRDAFRRRGHDAISCDLLPTESEGPHIQGDCLGVDWSEYELLICHPPCTFLCNSGRRWLDSDPMRLARMEQAAGFFRAMLALPVARIAVENPIPHALARERIGAYAQLVQPWQFGTPERKATCLWLRGLPPLIDTCHTTKRHPRVHLESPGPDRWKARSQFPVGIADAMAVQWGSMERIDT